MGLDKVPQFVKNDVLMSARVIEAGEEYESLIDVADGLFLEIRGHPSDGVSVQYRLIVDDPLSHITVESVRGNPNQTIVGQLAKYIEDVVVDEGLGKSISFTEEEESDSDGASVFIGKARR